MNAGLLIGRVRDRKGNKISGARVWIFNVAGMAGGAVLATNDQDLRLGSPSTETDSTGFYNLAYAWSGADVGPVKGGAGRVRMLVAATATDWHSDNHNTSYDSAPVQAIGYLFKDMMAMAGLKPPDINSIPGLVDYSKEILDSMAKLKGHPIFKQNMLTPESWLLLGSADLVVNK